MQNPTRNSDHTGLAVYICGAYSISIGHDNSDTNMLITKYSLGSPPLPRTMPYGDSATFLLPEGIEESIRENYKSELNSEFGNLFLELSTTVQTHKIDFPRNVRDYIQLEGG